MNREKCVFDQVGYIINQYVPELYKFEMFQNTHIIEIIDHESTSIQGFEKYINLKYLTMSKFNDDLTPLINTQLEKLNMSSFVVGTGSFNNMKLKKIKTRNMQSIDEYYIINKSAMLYYSILKKNDKNK